MNETKKSLLIILMMVTVVLSSCSYSSYIPITVYEPMLKEKGECQGVLYLGANHVEVQGAYAFTKHFAVQGDVWKGSGLRYSVDMLPGYYYHAPKGFCFGMYAGGEVANTSGMYQVKYGFLKHTRELHLNDSRYSSLVCQPGIGYKDDLFEFGFAIRCSYVSFSRYDVKFYSMDADQDVNQTLIDQYSNDHMRVWVIQPALNFSVGLKQCKAFFSTSFNAPAHIFGNNSSYIHPSFQNILFSSGLKVDLMGCKKNKKTTDL